MNALPMPATALPGLEPLLNGGLWRRWSDQGKVFHLEDLRGAVRYVRLKPRTSCRLAVFNVGTAPHAEPPAAFLLHLFPSVERAALNYLKIFNRPRFQATNGFEPFMSESHAAVVVPFPNDSEVPGLRHFYRNYRLTRSLLGALTNYPESEWRVQRQETRRTLLAYKPGRRAVFRVDLEIEQRKGLRSMSLPLHVKVQNRDSLVRTSTNLTAIQAALPDQADWRVPAPLGRIDERATTVTEWIDGVALVDLLGSDHGLRALRRTGHALAGLHRLQLPFLPLSAAGFDEPALLDLGRDLSVLLPQRQRQILNVVERLARRTEFLNRVISQTIHGDFHLGQVLLDGDRPVIVDFDRAGRGHPLVDVGSILADLHEKGAAQDETEAFLDGYADADARSRFAESDIAAATAVALFRRAILPFRRLDSNWPEQIISRLERVDRMLRSAQ